VEESRQAELKRMYRDKPEFKAHVDLNFPEVKIPSDDDDQS